MIQIIHAAVEFWKRKHLWQWLNMFLGFFVSQEERWDGVCLKRINTPASYVESHWQVAIKYPFGIFHNLTHF